MKLLFLLPVTCICLHIYMNVICGFHLKVPQGINKAFMKALHVQLPFNSL